jgi:acetyltransferase-like isoleucine patch superfamily enzyme
MNNPFASRILGLLRRMGSAGRSTLLRTTGVRLGRNCTIGAQADLYLGLPEPRQGQISLGDDCQIGQGVVFHPYGGSIAVGNQVYVGPYSVIFGHGSVTIGDHTLIAMHCRILSSNHTIPPPDTLISSCPDRAKPVTIGSDVWLGAGVTVLAGVTIGNGCVVGAASVVTHDLPPFSVAVGTPARIVRQRA